MATKDGEELSPLDKYFPLHLEFSQTCRKIYDENCNKSLEERVQNATSFCKHEAFLPYKTYKENYAKVPQKKPSKKFMDRLIREEAGIEENSKKFDDDERILCLKLFVSQRKYYHFLSIIFKLPSQHLLFRLLDRVEYKAGFNEEIFKKINENLAEKSAEEKVCVLILGEIFVCARMHYNEQLDRMIGFEEFGGEQSSSLGSWVNLFMLQSLYNNEGVMPWNQPVYYALRADNMKTECFITVIKQILNECFKYGIEVVAIVGDGNVNEVEAINSLLDETHSKMETLPQNFDLGSIRFQDKEIVPLYDISYILLDIRNWFFKYNIHYFDGTEQQIAKWKDIIDLFEQGKLDGKRMVQERYIDESKILEGLQLFDHKNSEIIASQHSGTGKLLKTFANLYDSLNRYQGTGTGEGLQRDSNHINIWEEAIEVLASIKFHSPNDNELIKTPKAITNLMSSLQGFKRLTNKLLFEKNFDYIAPRLISTAVVRNLCPDEVDSYNFKVLFNSYIVTKPSGVTSPDEDTVILSQLLTPLPEIISQPDIDPPPPQDLFDDSFELEY